MAMMGMIMGGHVRVGLEDNIYYSKGVLAKSNAELVERVVRIAGEFGREIANAKEARKIINLPDRQVPRLA
jgi:3-keto-5-aminohexanoate cleavage enzyme